ncbi:uncharacterized protein LOC128609188 isoform X2 [Ictalurus furcatus]|uniref:uncharacterized protein LOC128609188 isoform X2 n=1 Tax=Ictalurus furcatus TaxID=66913 RepID=UPI002350534B|nr:uncharacterized protein LOC128609188 isoform X2 [Ictalurus furcatus]
MAAVTSRGIPLSSICPWHLHANSTSHTWPFSAIAELIDNAYDPDVGAKQLWIDKSVIKDQDCLIFMDNGNGMDYDKMHKMLSFGFSDKQTVNEHVPVGRYGNGFKSGSMRLGKDAIVFSKKADTMCVGLLSQTYLEDTGAQNVMVPTVTFTNTGQTVSASPEHAECLHDILTHSLFNTKEELLSEFSVIDRLCTKSSGTRIIIWNLRRTPSEELEFDFTKNPYDIRIPVDVYGRTGEINKRQAAGGVSVPESEYSLRAYCSILYMKPRMQIIIQGLKVETQLITKTLANVLTDTYKPDSVNKAITITFGYNTKSKEHYGLMMYHNNRLIKAYERVACQRKYQADRRAVGVIGVIECNHLTPTHNKQGFDDTEDYRKTLKNVGNKLKEYWKQQVYVHELKPNCTESFEDTVKQPDQNCIQCDNCLKWRKLPDGIDPKKLPKKWFCHMNSDPQFRSCTVEEEPEVYDDEQPRNQKSYKQHERNQKLQQENRKQSSFTPLSPDDTSADACLFTTRKRKKKALDASPNNPEKKSRQKCFDKNIPDSIMSPASDANKVECKDIKTALKDDGDDVIDKSMIKKEQSNKITKASFEDQQKYSYIMDTIRQLQDKLIQFKKVLKTEEHGVDTFSNYCESLHKDLEEMKTEIEKVEVSAKDHGPSTETSNPGRGKDSQFRTWKDETQYRSGRERGHRDNKMHSPLMLRELRQRVTRLLVTFVPALDLEQVIEKILAQVVDVISPTEAAVLTKEVEVHEEHLSSGEDNRSKSTQHSHTRDIRFASEDTEDTNSPKHSVVRDALIPELEHCADSGAYRFLCSHAGQFHCKLTNLVFEMKGNGEVLYTIVSWDYSQWQGIGQFQPAGPLYNIKCAEGSILYLHLPHCEIQTVPCSIDYGPDENQVGLFVAHFSDDNVEIIQPLKVTNTHVIFKVQGLSLFGLLKKWIFFEKPISAQVLLFYKEMIGNQRRRKLHIHLLPGNVPVEEVQKVNQCNTYIQCSSICQLTRGKKYRPLCEPYVSQPKVETFGFDYGPNYHPTFEVILNTGAEDLTLGLLDEFGQEVWEPRQIFLTADSTEAVPVEMDTISRRFLYEEINGLQYSAIESFLCCMLWIVVLLEDPPHLIFIILVDGSRFSSRISCNGVLRGEHEQWSALPIVFSVTMIPAASKCFWSSF